MTCWPYSAWSIQLIEISSGSSASLAANSWVSSTIATTSSPSGGIRRLKTAQVSNPSMVGGFGLITRSDMHLTIMARHPGVLYTDPIREHQHSSRIPVPALDSQGHLRQIGTREAHIRRRLGLELSFTSHLGTRVMSYIRTENKKHRCLIAEHVSTYKDNISHSKQ